MIAECAWELSCIILDLDGDTLHLHEEVKPADSVFQHGTVTQGDIDLSISRAKELLSQLQEAIKQYDHLEEGLKDL